MSVSLSDPRLLLGVYALALRNLGVQPNAFIGRGQDPLYLNGRIRDVFVYNKTLMSVHRMVYIPNGHALLRALKCA